MTNRFIDQLKNKNQNNSLDKGHMTLYLNEEGFGLEQMGVDRPPTENELIVIHYLENIGRRWQNSIMLNFAYLIPHAGETRIAFTIDKTGTLTELHVVESSGDQKLDTMLLYGLKFAAPFAPLPKEIKGDFYQETINFRIG